MQLRSVRAEESTAISGVSDCVQSACHRDIEPILSLNLVWFLSMSQRRLTDNPSYRHMKSCGFGASRMKFLLRFCGELLQKSRAHLPLNAELNLRKILSLSERHLKSRSTYRTA
jgi:hypothetical protein